MLTKTEFAFFTYSRENRWLRLSGLAAACRLFLRMKMPVRAASAARSMLAIMVGCALSAVAGPSLALEKPSGPVILTITGTDLKNANSGQDAVFDLAMLERLAGREAVVETPWLKGKVAFRGPYLRSVLEAAGASGGRLTLRALNDYAAELPMEDAKAMDTILATRLNGAPMSVRDKGPLFLIYPFDKDGSLYNEIYFARSVWQIKTIEVRP